METPDELTTIATFSNTAEADLAKERLEQEGLSAFVVGSITAHVIPHLSQGGNVWLQVATADAAQAREVLDLSAPA